jgi:polyribonucleotide nucleotidyltransferase
MKTRVKIPLNKGNAFKAGHDAGNRVEQKSAAASLFSKQDAKQQTAVVASYGDCIVLGTVSPIREGIDFFPLTVDYREGVRRRKFPGFFKRRAPTGKEILTMRMIDRPIRPLFPQGFNNEIQIQTMVLAADPTFDPDITAIVASSPPCRWQGPSRDPSPPSASACRRTARHQPDLRGR